MMGFWAVAEKEKQMSSINSFLLFASFLFIPFMFTYNNKVIFYSCLLYLSNKDKHSFHFQGGQIISISGVGLFYQFIRTVVNNRNKGAMWIFHIFMRTKFSSTK